MKRKLLLSIAVAITLLIASCEKSPVGKCGQVIDFPYADGYGNYKLPVKFDDGSRQDVTTDAITITTYYVGQRICF